jgi:hypothetical protein
MKRGAAGALETDRGGLVPDVVVRAEVLDEHHHVDGIDRPIHAAAEDRPDVVARAQRERNLQADLAPVVGDVREPPSGTEIGGEQVDDAAGEPGAEGFTHSARLIP